MTLHHGALYYEAVAQGKKAEGIDLETFRLANALGSSPEEACIDL